jgi:Flp pilus assembly protein TadG
VTVHKGAPRATDPPRRAPGRTRGARDGGFATVEVAGIVLPLAAIMTMFAIFCFRLAGTELDMNAAAAAAARAASLAHTRQAAVDAATSAAQADLAEHTRTCTPLTVQVDTSAFVPGGLVAVTLTCKMSTAGLTGLGLPGTLSGSATATAVIDSHVPVGA